MLAEKPSNGFVVAVQSITAKHTTESAQEAIEKLGVGHIVADIHNQVRGDVDTPIYLVSQGDRRKEKREDPLLLARGVAQTLAAVARALSQSGFTSVSIFGVTDKTAETL